MNSQATFKLKCVLCGQVEKRAAEECKGDPPACSKCLGPMILQSVIVKRTA
jgi:hypothetical protein